MDLIEVVVHPVHRVVKGTIWIVDVAGGVCQVKGVGRRAADALIVARRTRPTRTIDAADPTTAQEFSTGSVDEQRYGELRHLGEYYRILRLTAQKCTHNQQLTHVDTNNKRGF